MSSRDLLALANGGLFSCGDVQAQYEYGLRCRDMHSYSEAISWLLPAADSGHADAQFSLGELYESARGRMDQIGAFQLFLLAAKQGHAGGQYKVGTYHELGRTVAKSVVTAAHWYKLASDQGNVDAQAQLGWIYINSRDIPNDVAEGQRLLRLAVEQNNAVALKYLTIVEGVRERPTQAEIGNNAKSHSVDSVREAASAFADPYWAAFSGSFDSKPSRRPRKQVNKASIYSQRIVAPVNSIDSEEVNVISVDDAGSETQSKTEVSESPKSATSKPISSPLLDMIEASFADYVGLDLVRDQVLRQASLLEINKHRLEKGLGSSSTSRHLVFAGNPGTGKTTIARVIASLYHRLGILKSDKVIETDRAGMVAPYIGQTALKTKEVIESALGGVLFIDEAYTLARGGSNDFGLEAIDTLLKMMEDHRDNLVVIVAGYESEMDFFIEINPGLASRFNRRIRFPNYKPDELSTIFFQMIKRDSYSLSDCIEPGLKLVFTREIQAQDHLFSNGRYVRNLYERVLEAHAYRLVASGSTLAGDLQMLSVADVESALGEALPTPSTLLDSYEVVAQRIDGLVGLAAVKEQVHRLADFVRMQRARSDAGFKVVGGFSHHLVFTGNPGTGKTTVARIVADLYFALGVLPSNRFVEVDRAGLVAGYIGQSAIKTRDVIETAVGGVLFIDEAYALSSTGKSESDFGQEVIDTLLRAMEEYRDRLVVIVAGYSDEMVKFVDSNPGLRSRFGRYITFDDFPPESLVEIFISLCASGEYEINSDALTFLSSSIGVMFHDGQTNGNGRFVRNLFERCVEVQSQRVSNLLDVLPIDLKMLTLADVTIAIGELMKSGLSPRQ